MGRLINGPQRLGVRDLPLHSPSPRNSLSEGVSSLLNQRIVREKRWKRFAELALERVASNGAMLKGALCGQYSSPSRRFLTDMYAYNAQLNARLIAHGIKPGILECYLPLVQSAKPGTKGSTQGR